MIRDLIEGYKIAKEIRRIDEEDDYLNNCIPIEETKMWKEHWTIPIDKLEGERFGQIIFNAIAYSCKPRDFYNNHQIADRLFNVENKELERLIEKYLGDMK
jgi:hypothetical protein